MVRSVVQINKLWQISFKEAARIVHQRLCAIGLTPTKPQAFGLAMGWRENLWGNHKAHLSAPPPALVLVVLSVIFGGRWMCCSGVVRRRPRLVVKQQSPDGWLLINKGKTHEPNRKDFGYNRCRV
jgi:hypothetical protein